jgi:hypothetical protein
MGGYSDIFLTIQMNDLGVKRVREERVRRESMTDPSLECGGGFEFTLFQSGLSVMIDRLGPIIAASSLSTE